MGEAVLGLEALPTSTVRCFIELLIQLTVLYGEVLLVLHSRLWGQSPKVANSFLNPFVIA